MSAHHLLVSLWIAENEITKTESLFHHFAEVHRHLLGVFVDEIGIVGFGLKGVFGLCRLEDERKEGVAFAQLSQQMHPSLGIHNTATRIAGIGDDAQHVVGVAVVEVDGFFVGAGEHDFRTSAHAKGALVFVEGFGGKLHALLQHEFVQLGQNRGIETDIVFDKNNLLHAPFFDVVIEIHLVFNQLDDGEQQIGVSQPTEYVFKVGKVFIFDARGDAVAEGGEHHEGNVLKLMLDASGNVEGVAIVCARHHNDEVERIALQFRPCLSLSAHLREARRIAQGECGIFIEEFLVNASIVFEHEGIVGIGDKEHIEDTPRHEIDKRGIFEI